MKRNIAEEMISAPRVANSAIQNYWIANVQREKYEMQNNLW
jgi:hypothetical protein